MLKSHTPDSLEKLPSDTRLSLHRASSNSLCRSSLGVNSRYVSSSTSGTPCSLASASHSLSSSGRYTAPVGLFGVVSTIARALTSFMSPFSSGLAASIARAASNDGWNPSPGGAGMYAGATPWRDRLMAWLKYAGRGRSTFDSPGGQSAMRRMRKAMLHPVVMPTSASVMLAVP